MHLRINYITTIRSLSMLIIIILVIIFCNKEVTKWSYFCHYWIFVDSFVFKRSFRLLSNFFLFQIMIKDCRTVLCPNIVTLSIKGSGIMRKPEYVKYFFKTNNFRVKFDLY